MSRMKLTMLLVVLVAMAGCSQDNPVATQVDDGGVLGAAKAVQRPIEEFVAAQGTFCWPNGMDCVLFVPPLENFLGWSDPSNGRVAAVDYAGIANAWIEDNSVLSLGTTFSGKVTERPLPNGTAHIGVVLHVDNALTWVADGGEFGDFNGPLLFGRRAPDVLLGGATVGSAQVQFEFTIAAPGAPMPDLMQLLFYPEEGEAILGARIRSNVFGELRAASGYPEGTPGKMNMKEISAFVPGRGQGIATGFPVEFIKLRAVSH